MRLTCPPRDKLQKTFDWFTRIPIIRIFFPTSRLNCGWRVFAYKTLDKSKYIDQMMRELSTSNLSGVSVLDEQAMEMYALAAAADRPGSDPYTTNFLAEEQKALRDLQHLHSTVSDNQAGPDDN
jgi:hypothetical protein